MEQPELLITRPADHPGVLVATLNRPPVNATTTEFFQTIVDFFRSVGKDPKARCVILTGAGRLFCGGADVKKLEDRTTQSAFFRSEVSRAAFDSIRRCALPVVGAINGGALGSGLVLAAACDIMICSENAYFGLPEVDVGVLGGTRYAAQVVPDKLVRYMALTGRRLDARTLLAMGGANAVVAHESLMDEAFEVADCLARKSPMGLRMMKESINLTEDLPVAEGYRIEQLYTTLASSMDESKEAVRAFMEKRDPSWVTDLKEPSA